MLLKFFRRMYDPYPSVCRYYLTSISSIDIDRKYLY
jgi:hypothetical protein